MIVRSGVLLLSSDLWEASMENAQTCGDICS